MFVWNSEEDRQEFVESIIQSEMENIKICKKWIKKARGYIEDYKENIRKDTFGDGSWERQRDNLKLSIKNDMNSIKRSQFNIDEYKRHRKPSITLINNSNAKINTLKDLPRLPEEKLKKSMPKLKVITGVSASR
ncbi:MAG: hypothetical protein M0009_06550 [Deltaproteobacteria bacterium]|nr:hypothetical protein [Deltaproteobacteria bacterium]